MLPDDNFNLPGEVLVQQPGLAEDPGQAGHQWVHHICSFSNFSLLSESENIFVFYEWSSH